MASLFRRLIPVLTETKLTLRPLSISYPLKVKEINIRSEGDVTFVEGVHVESERKPYLVDFRDAPKACPLCRLGFDIKYTDVLILSQFVRADGTLISKKVSGVCAKQQRQLVKMVRQAHRAGLMPNLRPDLSNGRERDPNRFQSNDKWRKYMVYFEEDKKL